MFYAKVVNNTVEQYPYNFRDWKADNPNVSFPDDPSNIDLSEWNIVEVLPQPDPAYDPDVAKLVQGVPVPVGDEWHVTRVVTPLTQQEIDDRTAESERQEDIDAIKADPEVLALLKARPDQINNYIDNNVTDLASAKEVLKILARASAVLAYTVLN